jgi:hypothetical protein
MEIWVNRDGTRNRDFRPYIDQEEYHKNVNIYNPNGLGPETNLYSRTQPLCQTSVTHVYQSYQNKEGPQKVIDKYGNTTRADNYTRMPKMYNKQNGNQNYTLLDNSGRYSKNGGTFNNLGCGSCQ